MNAPQSTGTLAPTVKLLINGQMVESKTTQWRDVVNPATQQVLARVPFATPDEVNAAVANAKEAFKTWVRCSPVRSCWRPATRTRWSACGSMCAMPWCTG